MVRLSVLILIDCYFPPLKPFLAMHIDYSGRFFENWNY
jgi:hypothetical protein